jgi:hypothetical protein
MHTTESSLACSQVKPLSLFFFKQELLLSQVFSILLCAIDFLNAGLALISIKFYLISENFASLTTFLLLLLSHFPKLSMDLFPSINQVCEVSSLLYDWKASRLLAEILYFFLTSFLDHRQE